MSVKRLVFITSLERSGSTLLDLTLGKHPQLVSFGEVARVILPHGNVGMDSVIERPCSCGKTVETCPFWSEVTKRIIESEETLPLKDRYSIFLSVFKEQYGESLIPVDSSKFYQAMEALNDLSDDGLRLKVLFTVRDVRGWILSSRRAESIKREVPYSKLFSSEIIRLWKPYLRHNILRHFPFWYPMEWWIRNSRIEKFLIRKGFNIGRLSYERLALDTEETLKKVYSFIEVDEQNAGERITAHIVRGNRMAFSSDKNIIIRYDAKWMSELWPQYEAMLLPFVMRKNNKLVYESDNVG